MSKPDSDPQRSDRILQILNESQEAYPGWGVLSQALQSGLDDDSFSIELQNLGSYAQVVAEYVLLKFMKDKVTLPVLGKDAAYFAERSVESWNRSGLKDEVIAEMMDLVLKRLGLYQPVVLEYFMLQHFVQKLEVGLGTDFEIQRDRVATQIAESLSQLEIKILEVLSESCVEMLTRMQYTKVHIESNLFYFTNCPILLVPKSIKSADDFRHRVDFLKHDEWGRKLRRFSFIRYFENRDSKTSTYEVTLAISRTFERERSDQEYLDFVANPAAFCEEKYQVYLTERQFN